MTARCLECTTGTSSTQREEGEDQLQGLCGSARGKRQSPGEGTLRFGGRACRKKTCPRFSLALPLLSSLLCSPSLSSDTVVSANKVASTLRTWDPSGSRPTLGILQWARVCVQPTSRLDALSSLVSARYCHVCVLSNRHGGTK